MISGIKEAEQSQPGCHDVEKAQGQICQGQDPEIVVPFFLHVHRAASRIVMTLAGHSFAHLPQPTHFPMSTRAMIPWKIWMASMGQTLAQQPQATQLFWSTKAFL